MSLNPKVIEAIEQLNYRVTVGDVAVQSGLELKVAQPALMAVAAEAGGHLQVTETGEIAYLFSHNFRAILRAKFLKLRLLDWAKQIWRVLFYLIRISFGILLIASICLIAIAILIIIARLTLSDGDGDSGSGDSTSGDGSGFMSWIFTDWYYFFGSNPYDSRQDSFATSENRKSMSFLEAVFSFLFGDGNPNHNLRQRRWQEIGKVLRQQGGAVAPEQVIPFLEQPKEGESIDDAMLPVLLHFNGQPEVSADGEIVYHFPDLQTSVEGEYSAPVNLFLKESRWKFSHASLDQILGAMGLGSANLIGAVVLGQLLGGLSSTVGFLGFIQAIYVILLGYGISFLAIPLGRYFWIQWQNQRIAERNQTRAQQAEQLYEPPATLKQKLNFARQFARSTLLDDLDLAYTTEKDLLQQDAENQAAIDAAWEKRLGQPMSDNTQT